MIYRYHRLWADAVNEIEHGFTSDTFQASYVEGYFWSPMEKRRFFSALDKCGPHDPAAIQQRIGPSKTIYQVQLYISQLQEGSEDQPMPQGNTYENARAANINNTAPFAYEMSPAWIAFEEQQAQHLSAVLDKEAIVLDHYHRSVDKHSPLHAFPVQLAMDHEMSEAQELIDPSLLYEWAAR
ncbi:hypothetical protein BCR42DRAFT_328863 [Absidia repens]|uniref:Myb-like domain-containing protein n=1 Tax=Absidia repens TaxID=90262 RepID=A0A1X2IG98_9FUNG|nr:hypothetical protein BCR42DRAFT_328863 [Absidia repens]